MADITLTYKGNTILELNDSATKSIKTAGKYLEDDIGLSYAKSGGAGRLFFNSTKDKIPDLHKQFQPHIQSQRQDIIIFHLADGLTL